MSRSQALQNFLDAAFPAFDEAVRDPASRASIRAIFAHLEVPGPQRQGGGRRLPVCEAHLDGILSAQTGKPALDTLLGRFRALEPALEWKTRTASGNSASENFPAGHANAMIAGPGALEERRDVWLGVSLLAPNVRYPDHDHPPEETYLVMTPGEFMHGDSGWFTPGVGGSFFNTPGIRHAMRAGDTPLFAFWALLPERAKD